jgi:hypothetical protein
LKNYNRELSYSGCHSAIGDKRKEMRRDILLCLCTYKVQVVNLPLLSPLDVAMAAEFILRDDA